MPGRRARPTAASRGATMMTDERFAELMSDDDATLSDSEIYAGWHFCPDWDGLLIGPGMIEIECCTCVKLCNDD